MQDFVYFVRRADGTGPVKIGLTGNIQSRLWRLRTIEKADLCCLATFPGCNETEGRFHALFYNAHIGGEWFTWTNEIARVVAEINAGTFDATTLPERRPLPTGRGKHRVRRKPPTVKVKCAGPHLIRREDDGSTTVIPLHFVSLETARSQARRRAA